jgi:hypothetical protein
MTLATELVDQLVGVSLDIPLCHLTQSSALPTRQSCRGYTCVGYLAYLFQFRNGCPRASTVHGLRNRWDVHHVSTGLSTCLAIDRLITLHDERWGRWRSFMRSSSRLEQIRPVITWQRWIDRCDADGRRIAYHRTASPNIPPTTRSEAAFFAGRAWPLVVSFPLQAASQPFPRGLLASFPLGADSSRPCAGYLVHPFRNRSALLAKFPRHPPRMGGASQRAP